jgi:hypothetical protein
MQRGLAGKEFTAADIMSVFPLTTVWMFIPFDLSVRVSANIGRVGWEEGDRDAITKGDPSFTPMLGRPAPELFRATKLSTEVEKLRESANQESWNTSDILYMPWFLQYNVSSYMKRRAEISNKEAPSKPEQTTNDTAAHVYHCDHPVHKAIQGIVSNWYFSK